MPFFGEEPPPEPPRSHQPQPEWIAPPDGELGGWVPLQVELARSGEHLVLLGPLRAHPTGVELSVEIRNRAEHLAMNLIGPRSSGDGSIRFGVRFADGSSTSSSPPGFPARHERTDGPVLMSRGGGGGGGRYEQRLWLWPLPVEGDIQFFMKWDFGGFDERMVVLDGDAIRAAARRVERLWEPLSEEERRAGERQMMEAMQRFSSTTATIGFSLGSDPAKTDDSGPVDP